MGSVLVPKGPRVTSVLHGSSGRAGPDFDRAEAVCVLFALPVPPPPRGHRTYPIDTPLGRVMRHKHMTIEDVVRLPIREIPNARIMSDMLAGRRDVSPKVAQAIARGLGVDWRLIVSG